MAAPRNRANLSHRVIMVKKLKIPIHGAFQFSSNDRKLIRPITWKKTKKSCCFFM